MDRQHFKDRMSVLEAAQGRELRQAHDDDDDGDYHYYFVTPVLSWSPCFRSVTSGREFYLLLLVAAQLLLTVFFVAHFGCRHRLDNNSQFSSVLCICNYLLLTFTCHIASNMSYFYS